MRKNYDFSKAIKNPYAKRLKRGLGAPTTNSDNQDKPARSAISKKRKAEKSPQRSARAGGISAVKS